MTVSIEERLEVEQFLYREARLADEGRYEEWQNLFDEETRYWVPGGGGAKPGEEVAIIDDNRTRLATRIRQLRTGLRYAQSPPSPTRRLISNIEIEYEDDCYRVTSNFVAYEIKIQSTHETITWCGQYKHELIKKDNKLLMRSKTVYLVNRGEPIPSLTFLI